MDDTTKCSQEGPCLKQMFNVMYYNKYEVRDNKCIYCGYDLRQVFSSNNDNADVALQKQSQKQESKLRIIKGGKK